MPSPIEYMKYLPVSDRDKAWGIFMLSSGLNVVAPGSHYPVLHLRGYSWHWGSGRTLDDFQMLMVLEGEGEFESRPSGRLAVGKGNVILLFPGVWHRYRPSSRTGWTEHWITFNGDFALNLMRNGVISPKTPVLRPGVDALVTELSELIAELIRSESVGYQQVGSMRLLGLLAVIDANTRRSALAGSKIEQKIRAACDLMANHLDGPMRMPELADSLNLGYSWFRRMFKEYTGHAPAQYHLQLRINRAKHLLIETNLSVKEISTRLGFETPNHFSSVFKKLVGESPTGFRAKATGG